MARPRLAVVLFNLGGPDGQASVRPFLFNLFNDPAIISLPAIVRTPLAALLAKRRENMAQANYAMMGGGSPLLPETQAQAQALETALGKARPDLETRVFIAMRYWKPLTGQTAREVEAFGPDRVVLLPLYPQYSTTTTASSLAAWRTAYKGPGRTDMVCCYPEESGLIEAHAERIREALAGADEDADIRLLFSAHGLPQKVIDGGDPYQSHVERTAAAVAARLGYADWKVCYQSRVGPMKWLGPSTLEAIEEAAHEGKGVVVCPIAFVSEHVETLVELDREYAEAADQMGCVPYLRAAAPGTAAPFIAGLTAATLAALARDAEVGGVAPAGRPCDACWSECAVKREVA